MASRRLAIIGAGPIGLEAALYAAELGFEISVFEKQQVGANILDWGHVRLFSPWKMNHSSLGVRFLKERTANWQEPAAEAYLTGKEFVEQYLRPLSQLPQLAGKIRTNTSVESVGRQSILKGELIGKADRTAFPFRLLTVDANGREAYHTADMVIDSSGVYGSPNWLGEGGVPALGERQNQHRIDYHLRDIYGADRARFSGKRTLLVGAGYSAATTICAFQNLIREEPQTSVLWVTREDRDRPIPEIADDPLPDRLQLTKTANLIALHPPKQIEVRNNTSVGSVDYDAAGKRFTVGLRSNGDLETVEVDRIIANVGYGPDNSLYRELQVHECYASRGPMKLAAALLGASSADCLEQGSMGAETLENPEPNFFIIGNKSYGRNPTFLLKVGLSQIVEVFSLITGNKSLNLYEGTFSTSEIQT